MTDTGNELHVMPLGDHIAHSSDPECPCFPELRRVERGDGPDGWLYVHSALDGRELAERGEQIPEEKGKQ